MSTASSSPETIERLRVVALRQPGAQERASGFVKFQCPACAREGHDAHRDNAGLAPDGTWGCAWASDTEAGRAHWEAIRDVLGGRTRRNGGPPTDIPTVVLAPEPGLRGGPPGAPAVHVASPPGFVSRYVEVAQRRTDAPPEAHQLAAVLILSALAGSRVRLPLAYRRDGVRLVLWGMNVTDSTGGRKTTVNEFALDVIRAVLGDAAILPWKGSPEAFIQALAARDGQVAVFGRDEYSGLLKQMKRGGYVAGLAQDFIRAFDGLPIVMARTGKMNRTTGHRVDDTDRVQHPYLVKVCAATRTSFLEVAGIEDVLDGFLARFVFTSGAADERRMAVMTTQLEAATEAVVTVAREFHDRAQELLRVTLPEVVLDREWALEQRLKAAACAHCRPDAARPAMKRLAEAILKVAALLAIERADGEACLTLADLDAAETLAAPWQATTLDLIADLGRTRFQARCDGVLASIRAHPDGLTARVLYRAHRGLMQRELDDVTQALEAQGLAHRVKLETGQKGWPTILYRPGEAAP